MIGKISPHGASLESRVWYLYGPGKSHEDVDPHLVAGWRPPAEIEPPLRPSGRRDFRRLIGLLLLPHAAMGKWGSPRPVWHCLLSAAPTDRVLSDAEWGDIAVDVMLRTGLSDGEDNEDALWIDEACTGSPSGTLPTTSTWSRCWPGRTGGGPACRSTGCGCEMPAGPPRIDTGCERPARRGSAVPWRKDGLYSDPEATFLFSGSPAAPRRAHPRHHSVR
jgi:hypothetical protein